MKLELIDLEGNVKGTIELPVEEIKANLASPESSKSAEDEAQLKESQDKVAELEEKLATAESRTMDDFGSLEKGKFVIDFAKALSPEDKAIFAEGTGISQVREPEAEKKDDGEEPEDKAAEVAEEEGKVIVGKTDKPGYKFLPHLNISVKK